MKQLVVACVALVACGPSGVGSGGSGGNGHLGSGGNGGAGGSGGSGGIAGCSDAARELIYFVDQSNQLGSFRPATLQIATIGTLSCPTQRTCPDELGGSMPATPFAMAIDRQANAWVLYCSG